MLDLDDVCEDYTFALCVHTSQLVRYLPRALERLTALGKVGLVNTCIA